MSAPSFFAQDFFFGTTLAFINAWVQGGHSRSIQELPWPWLATRQALVCHCCVSHRAHAGVIHVHPNRIRNHFTVAGVVVGHDAERWQHRIGDRDPFRNDLPSFTGMTVADQLSPARYLCTVRQRDSGGLVTPQIACKSISYQKSDVTLKISVSDHGDFHVIPNCYSSTVNTFIQHSSGSKDGSQSRIDNYHSTE